MRSIKALLCASLLSPALAFADPPPAEIRYDFLDFGLIFGEVDSVGDDADFSGVGIAGSWGFHKNFALFAALGTGEIETALGDVDTTDLALGINPHFAITDSLDIVIPVAIEFSDFDAGFFSDNDTGYSIGVGVRWLINPAWELGGRFQHTEIFDDDEQTFDADVRWHLTNLFSLALGGSFGDDTTAVLLSGRFSFGG